MFRRCVSLLVIAGLLASQMAAMGHAHGVTTAEKQRQHDATPHVHCSWFGIAEHDHGRRHHGHAHHGHAHHGQSHHAHKHPAGKDKPSSSGDPQSVSPSCGASGAAHDADAVFLASVRFTVSATRPWNQTSSAWQVAALPALPDSQTDAESDSRGSPQWHPPDAVLDASKTYLTLRNLRI